MRSFALIGLLALARTAAADPPSCVRRFEAAKRELIASGFHPTSDHDTAKWLVVDGDATDASMGLEMGGADGPHIGYWVTVEKKTVTRVADWNLRKRALCCDDNHEADDHIIRFTWEKKTRGFIARIVLDRFGDRLKQTQDEADLFIAVARRAAEDCMR